MLWVAQLYVELRSMYRWLIETSYTSHNPFLMINVSPNSRISADKYTFWEAIPLFRWEKRCDCGTRKVMKIACHALMLRL